MVIVKHKTLAIFDLYDVHLQQTLCLSFYFSSFPHTCCSCIGAPLFDKKDMLETFWGLFEASDAAFILEKRKRLRRIILLAPLGARGVVVLCTGHFYSHDDFSPSSL